MPTADLILEQHAEKRSNRRVMWTVLWLALALLLGAPLIWSWSVTRKWERLKAEYEAAGETLDLAKLELRKVPDEENVFGLDELYAATSAVPNKHLDMLVDRHCELPFQLENAYFPAHTGFAKWYQQLLSDNPTLGFPAAGLEMPQNLTKWIDARATWIPKVLARLDRPEASYQRVVRLPYFNAIEQHRDVLETRLIACWEAKIPDDLVASLRLQICALKARLEMGRVGNSAKGWIDLLWVALQERQFDASQCGLLLREVARLDVEGDSIGTLRRDAGDIVANVDLHKLRRAPGLLSALGHVPPALDWCRAGALEPYFNAIKALKSGGLGATTGIVTSEPKSQTQRMVRYLRGSSIAVWTVPGDAFFHVASIIESAVVLQTKIDLARIALAAELYRFRHGDYPVSAAALVPEFLPSVPVDVMDGKPLRYARDGSRYRVWSIGRNGVDDGGKFFRVTLNSSGWTHPIHDGDWVWFYPKASE